MFNPFKAITGAVTSAASSVTNAWKSGVSTVTTAARVPGTVIRVASEMRKEREAGKFVRSSLTRPTVATPIEPTPIEPSPAASAPIETESTTQIEQPHVSEKDLIKAANLRGGSLEWTKVQGVMVASIVNSRGKRLYGITITANGQTKVQWMTFDGLVSLTKNIDVDEDMVAEDMYEALQSAGAVIQFIRKV